MPMMLFNRLLARKQQLILEGKADSMEMEELDARMNKVTNVLKEVVENERITTSVQKNA
jgi:hypothetical protein